MMFPDGMLARVRTITKVVRDAADRDVEDAEQALEDCQRMREYFASLEKPVEHRDYKMALLAQSAVNMSGILFEFAETMYRLCYESRMYGHGTDWRNEHPICRLYAEQIMHLAKNTDYMKAYAECEEKVG